MRLLFCTASSLLAVAIRRMRTQPRLRDWLEVVVMLSVLGAMAMLMDQGSSPINFDAGLPGVRADWRSFLTLALAAALVPALGEEIIFRSLLQPERLSTLRSHLGAAASLTAFILWHPMQVWTGWFTGQSIFLDPDFLLLVALLGLFCTFSVHRSGSLWGAVAMHWVVVVVWKAAG